MFFPSWHHWVELKLDNILRIFTLRCFRSAWYEDYLLFEWKCLWICFIICQVLGNIKYYYGYQPLVTVGSAFRSLVSCICGYRTSRQGGQTIIPFFVSEYYTIKYLQILISWGVRNQSPADTEGLLYFKRLKVTQTSNCGSTYKL